MAHALGLWHEQGRPKRDNYVTIHFEEVMPGFIENFQARRLGETTDNGLDYDYGSVMHYSAGVSSLTRKCAFRFESDYCQEKYSFCYV